MPPKLFRPVATTTLALLSIVLLWATPSRTTPVAVGDGQKLFQTYCFLCHGPHGQGNGVLAQNLTVKPRDLTDDTFMTTRTDQQLFDAIRNDGSSPHGPLAMPAWGNLLSAQDVWALVAYVRTLHRRPSMPGVADQGATLFARYCWTCHGTTGAGDGVFTMIYAPRPLDLADISLQTRRTDAEWYSIISQGGAAVGQSAAMPAWGHLLTAAEIRDLIAYIRRLARRP